MHFLRSIFVFLFATMVFACSGDPSVSMTSNNHGKASMTSDGGAGAVVQSPDDQNKPPDLKLNPTPLSEGGATADQGSAGAFSEGGAAAQEGCLPTLHGTLRDFVQANMPMDKIPAGITPHPDFESVWGPAETGIVANEVDADRKPVYAMPNGTTPSTHGKVAFDQWYHDDPTVNQSLEVQLELTDIGGGVYSYDNQKFFPIDGKLFGTSWDLFFAGTADMPAPAEHNYHFTLELHTRFTYHGGETFRFKGDDDVSVFINHRLAIDLGGVHQAMEASIALDDEVEKLDLKKEGVYELDFFFAERHLVDSTFRIDTTLAVCEPPTKTEKPPVIIK